MALLNLTKRFGKFEAVKNLNLEVRDGEFVAILGPSGCGKTTTLRMIAGLETPDHGEIYIGDRIVNDVPPGERDVSLVFQFYAIYNMSVYKNLAFPLIIRKIKKSEIDKRVREVADLLGIGHLLDARALDLTEGEKQRVALGRAIIRKPQVYLLDEPLTNLDARLRARMRVELKKLQRELGQTTIYVTHDQLEAMTMADRIAVMNQGILQQYDTPENVYEHPSNLFVAGFIGSPTMNFLEGTLVDREGKSYLDLGEFFIDLSNLKGVIEETAKAQNLILGVRPEDINVSGDKTPNSYEGNIDIIEPLGDKILLNVLIGNKLLKVFGSHYEKKQPGDKVWLTFNRDKIHIIDKETEKVII
ncbi:MAG: ABC transporter ATP-binding protein [Candidatus Bathyarchaeia archaeon]